MGNTQKNTPVDIQVRIDKHEPMKRNIPLCTYVAPAYLVMSAYLLI